MTRKPIAIGLLTLVLAFSIPSEAQQAGPAKSQTPKQTDSAIQEQVQAQFRVRPEFQNVAVKLQRGVVTLTGSVPTRHERAEAKRIASSVPGVRKVRERLTLSGAGVYGSGVMAERTAQTGNTAGSIAGNTKAETGAAKGAASQAQGESTSAAPSLNQGTQPAPPSAQATQPGTGGMAGAATAGTATTSPKSETVPGSVAQPVQDPAEAAGLTTTNTESLAESIRTALRRDPALANDNLMVRVTDDSIEVTGTVDSAKDKQTAYRIAQSYTGNRKLVDRVTIAKRATGSSQDDTTKTPDASTPEAGGSQQAQPKPPGPNAPSSNAPKKDPATQGDASPNPRRP